MNTESPKPLSQSKTESRRFSPLLLYLGYAVVLGVAVYGVDVVPASQMREELKTLVPVVLKVNLALVILGIVLCGKDLAGAIFSLINRRGMALAAVVAGTLLLAAFVAPRTHRIYYDEDIYANVGQTMAESGQAAFANYALFENGRYTPIWTEYNKEPAGWPFLLSLCFTLFGTDEAFLFVLNNLLFAGGVLIAFFITRRCGAGFFPSLAAAAVYGLIPHNVMWANTGAVEPSATFFAGATALAALAFLQSGQNRHLFLLSVLIPMACYMRPESLLIFFWVVVVLLTERPSVFAKLRAWGCALVTVLLLVPLWLHLSAVSGESWGAEGAKFSMAFFGPNLAVNGPYYLNGEEFPAAITVLALVGLAAAKTTVRRRAMLLLWFFLFWAVFLFFYAGSYNYGADERFALLSFLPLSVLAGLGAGRLRDLAGMKCGKTAASVLLGTGILFFAALFLPQVRTLGQEAWAARGDHFHAKRFAEQIPQRSVVLTQNPSMFLLWGRGAIQTYTGVTAPGVIGHLLLRFPENVYFHYNYWCNTPTPGNQRLCSEMMRRYELSLVDRATEQDFVYALYRVEGLKAGGGK